MTETTDDVQETVPLHPNNDTLHNSCDRDARLDNHSSCAQKDFNELYLYKEQSKPTVLARLKRQKSKMNLPNVVKSVFPIVQWLPNYKWHTDLFHDIVSGMTVAVMHIPQGLAYSILAGVPPVVGIYMAFFPVLIYALMGTSRQLSMGTFAIICMMAGRVFQEISSSPLEDGRLSPYSAIEVTTALSIVVGVWQLLLGILRLGSLCVILSEHLISGLVTGTAILVISSQFKHVFGLQLPKRDGHLLVIKTIKDVFDRVSQVNYMALSITVFVTVVLLIYQQYLKPIVDKKIPVPIPVELIAIISGAVASQCYNLPLNFNLSIVGDIPTGFPSFAVPPLELTPRMVVNGLVIAVISFSINISMASIFAEKHKYRINANQELIASGSSNMFGAFFSCPPFAASLSRSLIQDSAGGRTQLASIISCAFLSLVILFIAPFFKPLPHCVLTGIVFAAMKGMLINMKDFFVAWRQSRMDGCIWLLTFGTVVLVDIDVGLCAGVIASLLHITLLGQKVKVAVLGNIPRTDLYVEKDRYQVAEHVPGILVLHIVAGMNFANKDAVRATIFKQLEKNKDLKWSHVVLDLSAVSYIDPSSCKCLLQIYENLKSKHIKLHLAKCSGRYYCGLLGGFFGVSSAAITTAPINFYRSCLQDAEPV